MTSNQSIQASLQPHQYNRWIALLYIAIAELFALSMWFSASAVIPAIEHAWNVTSVWGAWITAVVQIGFVVGALVSSVLSIADRYNPRHLFAVSALLGTLMNTALTLSHGPALGLLLRFMTGVALAGVYPVAVKLLSEWFANKRGLGIGILIGALTLGSALPHFVVLFAATLNWRWVILTSSILALLSAGIMLWLLPNSPGGQIRSATVSFKRLRTVTANRPVMLANYGYFGHMWELYAMWTWLPAFLSARLSMHLHGTTLAQINGLMAFVVIGVAGAIGCIAGGWYADKIGRSRLTILAMTISGFCSITIGLTYRQPLYVTLIVATIWGVTVIADSAQFSAAVTEFAQPEYVGTALTFQMAIGFFITVLSINLIPLVQSWIGWQWTFSTLSIGPILGIWAMARLRQIEHPIEHA